MRFTLKIILSVLLITSSFYSFNVYADNGNPYIEEGSPLNVEIVEPEIIEEPAVSEEEVDWDNTENVVTNNSTTILPQKFSDIGQTHWAKTEIYQIHELGIVGGYPDGEFRASLPINRGQAANMLTAALKLEEVEYQPIFKDISSKSSFVKGALATYHAKIFLGKTDGTFGGVEKLTREQLATTLVRAFQLKDTGEAVQFNDWNEISPSHRENVKILAQHKIAQGNEFGNFDPKANVSRATFSIFLYRSLLYVGEIQKKTYQIEPAIYSNNYKANGQQVNFVQITAEKNPIMLRSTSSISLLGTSNKQYDVAKDTIYNYSIDGHNAQFTLTVRTFTNGDQFVFSTLKNNSPKKIEVNVFQKTDNVSNQRLVRFDRFKISQGNPSSDTYDLTTTPTGLLQLVSNNGHILDKMVGQAYRSRQLSTSYSNGGQSFMRELYAEYENFSYVTLDSTFYSFYRLTSSGNDIVESWYVNSAKKFFTSEDSMNSYMLENVINFKKRNKWYTTQGPFSKMALTTEPMPSSNKGYGRNLLLIKEDRALELLEEKGDRFYETLVMNSFVDLANFKGNDKYWYTEVTSTYLKDLYGITAPFVDTRFNEQIALFYYRGGKLLNIPNYKQPLKNYADLLVEQVNKGNVIRVSNNAYYIPDYFPLKQNVITHASMNHLLGGISILLHAYEEFGTQSYLNVARAEMNAMKTHSSKWLRPNGDLWYKVDRSLRFVGDDYVHLTLEDLTYNYYLWQNIDVTYLPLLESLIKTKANYLKTSKNGHTDKIKTNLEKIDKLQYLP